MVNVAPGGDISPSSPPEQAKDSKALLPFIGYIACFIVIIGLVGLLSYTSFALSNAKKELDTATEQVADLVDKAGVYQAESEGLREQIKTAQDENFLLNGENYALKLRISELEAQVSAVEPAPDDSLAAFNKLAAENPDLAELLFYRDNACIIDESDPQYFHCYGCGNLPLESFFICDVNYALSQGLTPCPDCYDE
jgi:regulator of replication initiation timing